MAKIRKSGDIRRKGSPPQSRTFSVKSEADGWAAVIESEMAQGVFVSRTDAENTTLSEALDRYEREIPSLKIKERLYGSAWDMTDPHTMTRAFERSCQRAKIEDLTFHDLRHEATSRFFEKGMNPMQVVAITGHKTLQMLKRYTHLKVEDLAELLN